MTFVNKVRFKMGVEGDDVRIAVTEAIDECIDEDILVDFFEQHREEVVEVSIYDYDEEDVRRTLFEEAKEMAKEELKETVIEELKREAKEELTQEVFAESQAVNGFQFFKVEDEGNLEYIIMARGTSDDVYMVGKLAAFQIQNLLVAYKE